MRRQQTPGKTRPLPILWRPQEFAGGSREPSASLRWRSVRPLEPILLTRIVPKVNGKEQKRMSIDRRGFMQGAALFAAGSLLPLFSDSEAYASSTTGIAS